MGNVPAVARDLALVKVTITGTFLAALLRVVDETRPTSSTRANRR